MSDPAEAPLRGTLTPGTRVEVRNEFDRSWARGFQVEAVSPSGYLIRRDSDDSVLPVELPFDDVRRERRNSMWWM